MCGRYAASRRPEDLVLEFEATDGTAVDRPAADGPSPAALEKDYNIAPTKPVYLVRTRGGARELSVARWGLVPSWAPDTRGGARLINARAESLNCSPAFRPAFGHRRCLIPADGWYEWTAAETGRGKQAYYLTPANGEGVAFAGLWEVWGSGTERVLSCAIVTTAATGQLTAVHDRMPLVLPRDRWTAWLDPTRANEDTLLAPTDPAVVAELELRPVGPAVGNVANNGEQLTAPWRDPAPPAQRLF